MVNLATNFSTQGSSLATPVLRWVPYANKRYCIATGKERQVSETKFKILKIFLVIHVTLTWHIRSGGKSATPSGPADNEEDREDVEILSPSQPATSTQPEHPLGHNPITWPEDLDNLGEA